MQVLNLLVGDEMATREAATVLELSERHTWRMLAAYRKEGAAALAHGNRGRRPTNVVAEETRQQVIILARTRYAGVNHTHLTELLAEREGVVLARSTVRDILIGAGLPSPRHRRLPRHRCRRQRMPQEGILLQLDGSHHGWLGDRGPWLTLLLAVDDATGTVPYALFREQEDTQGYFLLLQGIIAQRGIPLAVYTDRHAVFQHRRPGTEEASNGGAGETTQFGRALQELGVTQVFAHSPEAKGRVERANGTFQDRLVAEMRLAGANTLAEANCLLGEFLPRFNERFGVPAVQPESAYRLPEAGLDGDGVLCIKEQRRVAKDNTVQYHGRTLQLFPGADRPSYARARVEVQERLDGSLVVCCQGHVIPTQEAPPRPGSLRVRNGVPGSEAVPFRSLAVSMTPDCVGGHGQDGWRVRGADREGAAEGSTARSSFPRAPCPGMPATLGRLTTLGRRPTPRQQARWDAVQQAKSQGLPIREIARVLGISRNTVRKYVAADSPPLYPLRRWTPTTKGEWSATDETLQEGLTESLVSIP